MGWLLVAPSVVWPLRRRRLCPAQIKRVENQRLSFGIESPPEGLTGLSLRVHIVDVCDVQIASSHKVANIMIGTEKTLGSIESLGGRSEFLFQFLDAGQAVG